MEEWKEYKLGDVCSRLRSGKGIKSELISNIGSFPVIGGNGIRGYAEFSNFLGECAVIGRQGAYCGNVRYFKGEAYMTEHAIVVIGNEVANTYYLSCLLSLMHLGHLSAQSAQPGLSVQTLSKLTIQLPSLPTQQKIANILSSLDDKIEVNRRINENLEAQAQALFKSWFVDFEPFKDGEFVESELGMIPKGWRVGNISEVCKILSGFAFKSTSFVDEGKYKLITIKGVQDGYLETNGAVCIDEVPIKMPKYCLLDIGDILLSLTGNVGRCCFVDREMLLLNQRVAKLQPINCNDIGFVYTQFRKQDFKTQLEMMARGTAQANLSPIETSKVNIIIPNRDILDKFGDLINKSYRIMINNQQEISRLASLRDTLLPKLMSGEVDVNDVKI